MAEHSNPPVTIRVATAEDVHLIHAGLLIIARHLDAEGKVTATPEDLRKHGFGPKPAFTVLLAESGGEFAGMCLFFPSFSTWRGCTGAYIQDIAVEERFRGTGVGVALLRHTAAHVRAEGGRYLRLSVEAKNVSAQHFYERMGLAWSGEERIHAAYGEAFEALAGEHESGV
jgi:ribosomal protein S18 acetylase RimI-like enzyme